VPFDKEYWNNRYLKGATGWDIGYVSTPLKEYFDQLTNKELRILIPGCGNAYEAEYLTELGFKNVFLIDWSDIALNNFKRKVHHIPDNQLFCEDFFEHKSNYDLIVEQTFFSSILPSERTNYAKKVHELLVPGGKLAGLLFDDPLNDDQPPFGGNKAEYVKYFEPYFELKVFERAYNSIKPRMGRELFMLLVKK
jgi:SAM-dependent methyltransferase